VKRHGLQGPIDDALMDSFMIVRPTGKAFHEKTGAFEVSECDRAIDMWRKLFRGEARVKKDGEITDADIAAHNLILFGDPSSNKVLGRVAAKLPIGWTADKVSVGGQTFASDHHVPLLVYPNPLNPKKYVVLNSGFTFRDGDRVSNSRQTPKLPDWAIVDINTPATPQVPGAIPAAGFFDEQWRISERHQH
jgi:hypothetical protein